MGASLAKIQLSFFLYGNRAYEEFGSSGSSLSCDESVLCCTWLPGVKNVA
jgi:hypothetical protein